MRRRRGLTIAGAAASLILAGAVTAGADSHERTGGTMVHCAGVNECKGKGECAGPGHACAGMNECKGKGVVEMSAEECAKKGGKAQEKKM
jgi:uncharacterized membrane protein